MRSPFIFAVMFSIILFLALGGTILAEKMGGMGSNAPLGGRNGS